MLTIGSSKDFQQLRRIDQGLSHRPKKSRRLQQRMRTVTQWRKRRKTMLNVLPNGDPAMLLLCFIERVATSTDRFPYASGSVQDLE
jgi:hypothetical protein